VPNWELVDLPVTESIRLFFTSILQEIRASQESKACAYAAAFSVFHKCRRKR
jgi:hypothetical protein